MRWERVKFQCKSFILEKKKRVREKMRSRKNELETKGSPDPKRTGKAGKKRLPEEEVEKGTCTAVAHAFQI